MESNFESEKFQIDVITYAFSHDNESEGRRTRFLARTGKKSALRLDKN